MPRIDVVVESEIARSGRVAQLEGMFDAPLNEKTHIEWHGELPIDGDDWQVGLIVGPSGSGKSIIARELFGDAVDAPLAWSRGAVVDDFRADLAMSDVASVCQAVGFNTIPAWARPFAVLSNGEKFRVELARRLIESDFVVVDEFTSVVDRQVAQIGAHAVQKYVRRNGKRFVGVACHYDVIDWLQPDWLFEPATMTFTRRERLRRPSLDVEIARVHHSAWQLFAPYHYMSASLHKAARCFVSFVDGRPAAFAGVLYRPVSSTRIRGPVIYAVSRLVTLPDWQGVGLASQLVEMLGRAYSGIGARLRTYPAHPALVRTFQKSSLWEQKKSAGTFSPQTNRVTRTDESAKRFQSMGGRPCAVFEYVGPKMGSIQAHALIGK